MACELCGAVWSWKLGVAGNSVIVEAEFYDSIHTRDENLWVRGKIKSIARIRKTVEGLAGGSEMLQ